MFSRSLYAVCAIALTTVSLMSGSTSARAHHYVPCLKATYGAQLNPIGCCHRCGRCPEWVREGRAFRVDDQFGRYLLVWNLETKGWMHQSQLRITSQDYCRAAGI